MMWPCIPQCYQKQTNESSRARTHVCFLGETSLHLACHWAWGHLFVPNPCTRLSFQPETKEKKRTIVWHKKSVAFGWDRFLALTFPGATSDTCFLFIFLAFAQCLSASLQRTTRHAVDTCNIWQFLQKAWFLQSFCMGESFKIFDLRHNCIQSPELVPCTSMILNFCLIQLFRNVPLVLLNLNRCVFCKVMFFPFTYRTMAPRLHHRTPLHTYCQVDSRWSVPLALSKRTSWIHWFHRWRLSKVCIVGVCCGITTHPIVNAK